MKKTLGLCFILLIGTFVLSCSTEQENMTDETSLTEIQFEQGRMMLEDVMVTSTKKSKKKTPLCVDTINVSELLTPISDGVYNGWHVFKQSYDNYLIVFDDVTSISIFEGYGDDFYQTGLIKNGKRFIFSVYTDDVDWCYRGTLIGQF